MGAFFDSIHVQTSDTASVRAALEQLARKTGTKYLLGPPLNGWSAVYAENSRDAGQSLAQLLRHALFHLIVHDDDIFTYEFYRGGQLIDSYNSCPDYFEEDAEEKQPEPGGRPELLVAALPDPQRLGELKELLEEEHFTFESERMTKFAELFGLSNACASYDYLQAGDQGEEEIEGWDRFIHVEKQKEPGDEFLESARGKSMAGDLEGALADRRRALELNPALGENERYREEENAISTVFLAQGIFKKSAGDLDGALQRFNRAIELKPDSADFHKIRGALKKTRGDHAGALADFDVAIRLGNDSICLAAAYTDRAGAKEALGDSAGALADLDRAIDLDPNLVTAYNNRGKLRGELGDKQGAIVDLNRAIELDPKFSAAWNNRGSLKRTLDDLDGAIADHTRAINVKPDSAHAYNIAGSPIRQKVISRPRWPILTGRSNYSRIQQRPSPTAARSK